MLVTAVKFMVFMIPIVIPSHSVIPWFKKSSLLHWKPNHSAGTGKRSPDLGFPKVSFCKFSLFRQFGEFSGNRYWKTSLYMTWLRAYTVWTTFSLRSICKNNPQQLFNIHRGLKGSTVGTNQKLTENLLRYQRHYTHEALGARLLKDLKDSDWS